jgi:hypothetical protein
MVDTLCEKHWCCNTFTVKNEKCYSLWISQSDQYWPSYVSHKFWWLLYCIWLITLHTHCIAYIK